MKGYDIFKTRNWFRNRKGGEPVKEKRATIQIRIEPELKERLERIAAEKALNISALLRKWIEEFVEKEEKNFQKRY